MSQDSLLAMEKEIENLRKVCVILYGHLESIYRSTADYSTEQIARRGMDSCPQQYLQAKDLK